MIEIAAVSVWPFISFNMQSIKSFSIIKCLLFTELPVASLVVVRALTRVVGLF